MQRLDKFILHISLLFVLGLTFGISAQAQSIEVADNEKVLAIEKLWRKKGVIQTIREWQGDSDYKQKVGYQFVAKYHEVIRKDLKEYQAFFSNETITSDNLLIPNQWLDNKQEFYRNTLDLFEKTEYDPMIAEASMLSAPLGTTSYPVNQCTNMDFELGILDTLSWKCRTGIATGQPYPVLSTALIPDQFFNPVSKVQIYSKATPVQDYDALVGGTALPVVYPGSGLKSVKLEDNTNGWGLSSISKTFQADPTNPWLVYRYAVVLEDPGDHDDDDRPYFEVKVMDSVGTVLECGYYKVIAKPKIEGFAQIEGTNFYWRNWTSVVVPLDDYLYKTLTIQFTVADCALGGHMGYAYIDGDCMDDALTVNTSCAPKQTITAPMGFDHYHWTGKEIKGPNNLRTVELTKAGDYQVLLTTATGCGVTRQVHIDDDCPETYTNCTVTGISVTPSDCDPATNTYSLAGQFTVNNFDEGYVLIKVGGYSKILTGPFSFPESYTIENIPANEREGKIQFYVFRESFNNAFIPACQELSTYTPPASCGESPIACENCIKGFEPTPNKKYVVSVWVKEDGASPLIYNYSEPFVKIIYNDGTSTTDEVFVPTGEIIDGWQRISAEFTIPSATVDVSIQLATGSGDAYFDDLRIYPADGTFKTFVYDPVSLRLMAELDENNYATFYEYDEEGALVRIKKETERGTMTIQENRNYKTKKQ